MHHPCCAQTSPILSPLSLCLSGYMSKSMGASACYHPDYTAPHLFTATSHTPCTTRPNGFESSHPYPTQIGRDVMEAVQTPHSVPDPQFRSSISPSPYTVSQTQAPSRERIALKSTIPKESAVQGLDSADRCVLLDSCVVAHTVLLLVFPSML